MNNTIIFSSDGSTKNPYYDTGLPWYYLLTVKFILPVTIPAGIIAHFLSLIALSHKSVNLNSNCRYLLLFYTISESILIFFKDIQDGFLSDGMYWLTGGKYFVNFETISGWSCKFFRGCRFSTEVLASYSLTFINFER